MQETLYKNISRFLKIFYKSKSFEKYSKKNSENLKIKNFSKKFKNFLKNWKILLKIFSIK